MLASLSLSGRVALITGGAGGLGGGMARGLAEAGASVVVADRRDPAEAVEAVRKGGGEASGLSLDVGNVTAIAPAVQEVIDRHGQLDVLINCAAVTYRRDAVDITPEEWDEVMAVNLRGMFFTCQAAARHMIPRRAGKIINIASITSRMGMPGVVPYCTSKGGVVQMTASLAVEWGPFGLNVNAIAPGWHRSGFTTLRFADQAWVEEMLRHVPMGRVGEPEDLQGLAVFLSSGASDYVTGQTFYVDGGLTVDMSVKPRS
ncbi:MAG: glucose 1-dehydrogenase [Chloroflexi bacterium]|nr:glucose 1-dehydrogenase [Chloroflexota bacterium]